MLDCAIKWNSVPGKYIIAFKTAKTVTEKDGYRSSSGFTAKHQPSFKDSLSGLTYKSRKPWD